MPAVLTSLAGLSLLAWLYLAVAHGRFWRAGERLAPAPPVPDRWPRVTAVVPARNEADVVAASLASLLDQDYPGSFAIVLVDDDSQDGTGNVARRLGAAHAQGARLSVHAAPPMPPGWVGKMWAVASGVGAAGADTEYLLLTDADVHHAPTTLRRLVSKAAAEGRVLVSLMVRLHCATPWERLLVPAFVYFFQQLYPFPWVNDPRRRTAGAAGGCMLVRADALAAAGGIAAIRGEIIDDCALARRLKERGPIWLGLAERERSLRPYAGLAGIWSMVARTAYTQLRHSLLLLAGTLAGLGLVYLVPPLVVLTLSWHGNVPAAGLGAAAWMLAAWTFVPTLRLYGQSPALAPALPLAALLYMGMTLDSARRHWRGEGARWKGRAGAGSAEAASLARASRP